MRQGNTNGGQIAQVYETAERAQGAIDIYQGVRDRDLGQVVGGGIANLPGSEGLLWPLVDNQGTVRDVANNSATIRNHLKYDAFGKVTSETNTAVDHLFGFLGMQRDEATGLNYHRAPKVSRYTCNK